ncbi:MAG: precorrin-3B C(17)-methyltransferase [Chloroflexi bacterium]|nr:precorrin-3B C(17)-methyltransferase [Chloroflexota bacterium]
MTGISNVDDTKHTAIFAITRKGIGLGRRLAALLPGSHLYLPERLGEGLGTGEQLFAPPLKTAVTGAFSRYPRLVLIMAAGIAVRTIAGEIRDKHSDPAVVVLDDAGKFAISLLSGHAGGANRLAADIASLIGAQPVVTTASDSSGIIAPDLLGKEHGWEIEDDRHLRAVSAALVNGDSVGIYQDAGERDWQPEAGSLPDNVSFFTSIEALAAASPAAALVISDRSIDKETLPEKTLVYRPRSLVVGIGCNRGTNCEQIEEAVRNAFSAGGLSLKSIGNLATIDLKHDEPGLVEFARKYGLAVDYFSSHELQQAGPPQNPSEMVRGYVGTESVCESAAVLSSRGELVAPKSSHERTVTVAVARIRHYPAKTGLLLLVGIGPGGLDHQTFRARQAIARSEVVVGYRAYIDLIKPLVQGKETIATGMGAEVERVNRAISLAQTGKRVCLVSSGDSGLYGMAGLVGEVLRRHPANGLFIEVVPGMPALVAAASLLGSPITGDFASISLSDYLVPWEQIAERIRLAAQGDFVIVLYNPSSRSRSGRLPQVREIIMQHRLPATPAGIVTNACRSGQQVVMTDLGHMLEHEIDMNTLVIVGNSTTFVANGWMVTPRGYGNKYALKDES